MTILKIPVSSPTFNEIAQQLEQHGIHIGQKDTIQLEKTQLLIPPINYKIVTIRRDVLAAVVQTNIPSNQLIDFCEQVFEWVHTGKIEPSKPIPLIRPTTKSNKGEWT